MYHYNTSGFQTDIVKHHWTLFDSSCCCMYALLCVTTVTRCKTKHKLYTRPRPNTMYTEIWKATLLCVRKALLKVIHRLLRNTGHSSQLNNSIYYIFGRTSQTEWYTELHGPSYQCNFPETMWVDLQNSYFALEGWEVPKWATPLSSGSCPLR
mgnify:CR=1 FL=1